MNRDETLAAILATVQVDVGNRGLARDPVENLFTATEGDFAAACRYLAASSDKWISLHTGFYIPTGNPPAFETDGPLGVVFLLRALACLPRSGGYCYSDESIERAFEAVIPRSLFQPAISRNTQDHISIAIELSGPARDGHHRTMRGRDITAQTQQLRPTTRIPIAIGDGGNEIGMGKISPETIRKNIPQGELIHCVVPADHLIVVGVSNWGAYALAAGLFALSSVKPPPDLFDPDHELAILRAMVAAGPLVDGVTGEPTATVDGLSWDDYTRPLVQMQTILDGVR